MYQIIDYQFEQRRQQIDSGSNFVIGVGTVYGQLYHTVEPINEWLEHYEWCEDLFGRECSVWDHHHARWYINDRKFWFRDEADLLVFILRWA